MTTKRESTMNRVEREKGEGGNLSLVVWRHLGREGGLSVLLSPSSSVSKSVCCDSQSHRQRDEEVIPPSSRHTSSDIDDYLNSSSNVHCYLCDLIICASLGLLI